MHWFFSLLNEYILILTFWSSFSISRARKRSGPRTAYSIFRRFVKTLSSVRILVPGWPLAMPRCNVLMVAGRWITASVVGHMGVFPADVPEPAEAETVNCSHVLGRLLAITAFHQRACGIVLSVGLSLYLQFNQMADNSGNSLGSMVGDVRTCAACCKRAE